jgi:long-subunit acyl-CoA synthetase (AMP-forming)
MGYLDRPQETAETYGQDGWFRTGDLGAIDEDGFITIHDRIKEMIKVCVPLPNYLRFYLDYKLTKVL